MSLKWIIVAILALPVAELGVYLLVASEIGFLRAFLLQVASSAGGVLVLRQVGRARLARWKGGLTPGTLSSLAGAGGAEVLGGILLFIPGFITDLMGVALLVPPLRRGLGSLVRHILTRYAAAPRDPNPVIDLDPGQWREIETRKRPKSRSPKRDP